MSKIKVDKLDSDNSHIVFGGLEHLDLSSNQGDMRFPSGTTDQRPTTEANGLVRGAFYYNTDYNKLQYFNGWSWRCTDGSRDYVTDGLRMNLDAASDESFTKQNLFKLPGWNYYGSGTTYSIRLPNHGCQLYSNYASWVGQFEANINTAQDYILEFTAYADQDGSSLVLDNDGINNNAFNQTYTVNQKTQTFRKTCTYTTTGNTKHYFRRNGGGNIYLSNVRLFNPFQDEIKNEEAVYRYGSIRALGGVKWMEGNYGHWNFDGSNDYFDLPDFDAGGGHNDYGGDSSHRENNEKSTQALDGFQAWQRGNNSLSCSMEMIVKQVGTNKALEIYGTESTCSSYPNSGFAYFPGSQGFFFYRFVQEGGDRPHVRATDTSVNLSDGNWHHFVGTYDEMTGYARLYRNGNLVSENNSSTQSSSFQGNFGGNATSYAFNGKAAVIRMYSKVLTLEEVKRNFNATKFRYGL